MRVHLNGDVSAEQFSALLLKIGDGEYPESEGKVAIHEGLGSIVTTIADLTARIYPDIANIGEKSMDWLCERAILTPKNDNAAIINDYLLKSFKGEEMNLNPPGFPAHKLFLKVGTPVMLLRNLSPPKLCNGTRLRVKTLQRNVIEATVFTGCAKGESVFIPRIPLTPSDYPFEFKRLQFPLKVCFAMTINKSQGQSLKVAEIDLRESCFSHGQFYVACSRVSSPSSLVILTPEGKTTNVVYKEVLK
ncbi:atp-dependent dna helicase pif6-like protein [Lasius niger]|uniref:Atp-dependent dna helicase pif6-like protein n=1 Tax=Lasius niger TaxID=67767 RepID=A0A0J7KGC7_LASNI|nr:atp-dependent dna helicase pif6-like protein [Lasius niger]